MCHILKQTLCFWTKVVALLFLLFGFLPSAGAENTNRALTLMIYMCGSNLESGFGAASADIREVLDSGFDPSISVLIMTGGSSSWDMGYPANEISIYEFRTGNNDQVHFRRVWSSEARSMGNANTLTELLRFGLVNYPADGYALILWDHGGGPLDGVCWDELFSMDNLRLEEVREGLSNALLPEKLRWIGFDACLMADLEIAEAVAPFADYMIASQETEPVFGWNYSFLRELSGNEDGAAAGRRIVDAFFEQQSDSSEMMTLACIDLSLVPGISKELNSFFSSVMTLDEESFVALSSLRMNTIGFGKSVLSSGEDAYDLADLFDLAGKMKSVIGDSSELQQILSTAVIYSRSGIEGAHGLSVYYPSVNKSRFSSQWRQINHSLYSEDMFLCHLEAFGSMLIGEETISWNHLQGEEVSVDDLGNHFAMQLTPDQAAQYVSGQLLILEQGHYISGKPQNFSLVGSFPAQMDENGRVTADFSGQTLYIRKENGNLLGPVSYFIRPDSNYNLLTAVYSRLGETLLKGTTVSFELEREADEEGIVPYHIKVFDDVTGSFSNRLAFHEEEYVSCVIPDQFRCPATN